MRARDFILLEYDQAKTLEKFSDRIKARKQQEEEETGNSYDAGIKDFLHILEDADPTAKKAFVLDLLRMYLDGSMRFIEDAYKATEPLRLYAKFRNRGLPSIKTLNFTQLLDLGDELSEVMSNSETNKAEEETFFTSEQAYCARDTDAYKVIVPFTEAAAIFFGRGTRWCTAAENNNMFSEYYKGGPDPAKRLWIVIFKGQKGKKWQLHIATGQFMDARDDRIEVSDWLAEHDFVKWFVSSVMKPCMPQHWEQIYRYYPDLDSLTDSLKEKIVSISPRLIAKFKRPTNEMISCIVQAQREFTVKQIMMSLEGTNPILISTAARLQLSALREFGLGFCAPQDVVGSNRKIYDKMVEEKFSKLSPNAAYNTAYHLRYLGQYALDHGLAGDNTDRVREGIAAYGL